MKFKKSTNILLSLLIAGSTFASPAFANTGQPVTNQAMPSSFSKEEIIKKINNGKQVVENAKFKATDKVRVIVEVAGETPIEYATKKNLQYQELSQSTKDSLEKSALTAQSNVKSAIKSKGIQFKYENSFTTVVNGFSGEINFGDLAKISELPYVTNVAISNEYKRPVTEPNMTTSHGYIQSHQTWADAAYKGEGMIISVIDTGVDPSHKDFVLSAATEEDLTADEVSTLIEANDLPGKFFTEKVPYGYNYFDRNQEILDLGPGASEHGMHVAGTTAANGDIKGVAPEAQVLAMKVFSNDPLYGSTYDDIYIAAIDDSIELGADVINMSLGSTAAYYRENDIANQAITRATANGIVVSVSSGNSGHIAYGWGDPFAKNPDIGVVGSPGLSKDSLQVAATGNDMFLYENGFTINGTKYTGYGADSWEALQAQGIEVVSLGGKLGRPEDYAGKDVAGKVVLVKRGSLSFYDKNRYATEAGAAGIIVYNNGNPVFYKDQGGWGFVPFMLVQTNVGTALEAAITAAGGTLALDVTEDVKSEGPEMGRMTDFTSWGTTPTLEIKPEISAPGGNIYSTLQNNSYGFMSGTSMAAPHVAGGSALVMQYIKEEYPTLALADQSKLAKVLLMNTAKNISDLNGQPFSPRRQGAGMMQTFAAVTTPVTIVNKATNEAKVELKDFAEKTFSMTLEAKNSSDTDVTYTVNTDVLTDTIKGKYNVTIAGDMPGVVIDAPATVTVPANDKIEFTVSVDLTNAKIPGLDTGNQLIELPLHEDIFVEGFVTLNHATLPDLNVPYVGFYGDWNNPEILDGFSELGEESFYDWSYMLDYETNFLPGKEAGYAISPNGDMFGDEIQPLLSFMRNAQEVQYNILDKDGKQLRRVKTEYDVRKSYFDAGDGAPYDYRGGRVWDATVKFEPVADGDYFYEIKTKLEYPNAAWKTKRIPVKVDRVEPQVQLTHDEETNKINFTGVDTASGILGYDIYVNGKSLLDPKKGLLPASTTSYTLPQEYENSFVTVVALDYALNFGWNEIVVGDHDIPLITLLSPAPLGYEGSLDVQVFGLVEDGTGVKELKVNGEPVEVQFDDEVGHYFDTVLHYESEGPKHVTVEATDFAENKIAIGREVFVDTTPGTITVNSEVPSYVPHTQTSYDLDVTVADNYREMQFFIDDNFEYGISFDVPLLMDGHTKNIQKSLELQNGLNTFELLLVDLGGHYTHKVINIYKLADGEEVPAAHITSASVTPELYVSQHRPAILQAESDEAITWNVKVTDPENNETTLETVTDTHYRTTFNVGQFALNGQYTVTFGGLNAAGQEVAQEIVHFTVYNYSTLISSVETLNVDGDPQSLFTRNHMVNIKANVRNLEGFTVSPMLILQVLDNQNRVVGKSFLTIDALNSLSTNGLGMQLSLRDLTSGTYKVEAYVWSGWDMNALAEAHKRSTFTVE